MASTDLDPLGFPEVFDSIFDVNDLPNTWAKLLQILAQRVVITFDTVAERDATMAGLGPSDTAYVMCEDTATLYRWNGTTWVPVTATSTAKAGKRMHWGFATVATDATGFATITHGAGFTPTSVVTNLGRTTGALYDVYRTGSYTATTFLVRVLDPAGGTVNNTSGIPIAYFCGE